MIEKQAKLVGDYAILNALIIIILQIMSSPNGLEMTQLENLYLQTTLRNSQIGPKRGILVKSAMVKYLQRTTEEKIKEV